MFPQMQPDHSQVHIHHRPQFLPYSMVVAMVGLSIVLGLTTQFSSVKHGNSNIAKLRADVVEIQRQMADRSDVQAIRQSLLQLEKDIKKVSDKLRNGR
jgi:Tfp pilus assembly protein PilN